MAVVLGATLTTITAITQAYNQNEWAQIAPYHHDELSRITGGTRQPPLDPLLGALVQHLLGEGQLRQRLVPVAAGVGSLVLLAALLRRMRTGWTGVVAMYMLATAPLFLRYSAYIRPYALPLFLMLACCWAGTRWLDTGRHRWLAATTLPALLLPLSRVPEPVTFLGTSLLVLLLASARGRLPWRRSLPLAAALVLPLVTVAVVTVTRLGSRTSGSVLDLDPGAALGRLDEGAHEIVTFVLPLLGDWFPLWPVTVAFLVLACFLGDVRRTLGRTWFWLPLLAAPVVFLLAYHSVNPYPLDLRHYRPRFAYFFVPPLVLLVAAVGHELTRVGRERWGDRGRWLGPGLVAVLLASQLPATARVLTVDVAPDFGEAGDVLRERLPSNAQVLYDAPSPTGVWRMTFPGQERYLTGAPTLNRAVTIAKGERIPSDGPVYLLVLDSECANSVVCDMEPVPWAAADHEVAGFEVLDRFDRFTLYAPGRGQRGVPGLIDGLRALREAYGPLYSTAVARAEAQLLAEQGRVERATALIAEHCALQDEPSDVRLCLDQAAAVGLGPGADDHAAGPSEAGR